eukprot:scaffold10653_cov52-Cyclotella_meneghiniana.AAC.2
MAQDSTIQVVRPWATASEVEEETSARDIFPGVVSIPRPPLQALNLATGMSHGLAYTYPAECSLSQAGFQELQG